jgi:hypothetical protein
MAVWPATLLITRDNYSESVPKTVIRSNMDVGPDKVRKRSSAQVRTVSFKLFLTDVLLQTFDDFFVANEALVFDFTDPRTNTAKRARFTESPTYNLKDTMWDVGVKIEYLP